MKITFPAAPILTTSETANTVCQYRKLTNFGVSVFSSCPRIGQRHVTAGLISGDGEGAGGGLEVESMGGSEDGC